MSDFWWMDQAREMAREIMDGAEFDEAERVIRLPMPDPRMKRSHVLEEFDGWEDVQQRLREIVDEEISAYAPVENGEFVFDNDGDDIVSDLMVDFGVEEFFDRPVVTTDPDEEVEPEPLFRAGDLLLPEHRDAVDIDLADVGEELIKWLARHPEKMYDLHPRKFEELVAELMKDRGWEVELTKATRDGGRDIRAFMKNDVGGLLTLVECKRHARDNPVDVRIVRALYGVVEQERATSGLIATTSRLTKDAKDFVNSVSFRMGQREFGDLKQWLTEYGTRRT